MGGAAWVVAGLLLGSSPVAPAAFSAGAEARPVTHRDMMTQGPGEFREGSYTDEHGTRRYRLYIPTTAAGGPRPLVVMLHGCTQDARDFAIGTGANRHAEAAGALVLYPEQPATAHPQKCWNWYDPAHQGRGAGEPALLAGMTRQIVEDHHADPERVSVGGLSAGGSMAQILVATYPELYQALAIHSAPAYAVASDVPSALAVLQQGAPDPDALAGRVLAATGERARPIPTLVIQGDADAVVRPVNGEQALAQWAAVALHAGRPSVALDTLRDGSDPTAPEERGDPLPGAPCPVVAGLDVERVEVEGVATTGSQSAAGSGARIADRCIYSGAPVSIEYWAVRGMGHAWSGGAEEGTYTWPAGPDATARVFSFLLADREASR